MIQFKQTAKVGEMVEDTNTYTTTDKPNFDARGNELAAQVGGTLVSCNPAFRGMTCAVVNVAGVLRTYVGFKH